MLVKKLLCLMGGVMLVMNLNAQKSKVNHFFVTDRIPDLPLYHIMNYKVDSAKLTSFGKKLIILDFWNLHCGGCIEMFPEEDSLQQIYKDKLQFILITSDPKEKIEAFLKRYDSLHKKPLSLPIVYGDSVLYYLFRHHSIPHYAWMAPNGKLFAQTNSWLINPKGIKIGIEAAMHLQQKLENDKVPEYMLRFPPPDSTILEVLKRNQLNY